MCTEHHFSSSPCIGFDSGSGSLAGSAPADPLFDTLAQHKLVIPTAVPGVFGRGAIFEEVLTRFDALVLEASGDALLEHCTFPPVIDRRILEKVEYLDWFPHLCGSVHSFGGDTARAQELSQRVHRSLPYGDLMSATGVVLNPSACYPLYPTLTGEVPTEGRSFSMMNWVFRHEPSREATRMQSFRVREFVSVGTPERVQAWRDEWRDRSLALLRRLQLPCETQLASDPFFGTPGAMMAKIQVQQKLKYELLVPVLARDSLTAVGSFNIHNEHFGTLFDIRLADGRVASTACTGFGLERVVMALFRWHGCEIGQWPAAVRALLWP